MGVFMKLAGLATAFIGGTLLTSWLLFVAHNRPLAVVALLATGALTIAWIVLITRAEQVQR